MPYLIGKGIDGISDAGTEKAGLAVAIIATVLFNFLSTGIRTTSGSR